MVKIKSWKKTKTQGFLFFANTFVKAISMPKKIPPIADNISPNVGLVKKAAKFQPSPHNTNAPNKQATDAHIAGIDGFSLAKRNIIIGTAMQDILSKNVFLAGVVSFKPINWNKYAAPKMRPAGIQIQYDLLISLNPLVIRINTNIAIQERRPLTATSSAGE